MGNVLCRHKNSATPTSAVNSTTIPQQNGNNTNSSSLRSPFDRIISRVQLCPSSLHNRPDHNKKNCNKCENNKKESIMQKMKTQTGLNNEKELKPRNQSTEWQDATLEAANLQEIKSIFADLINPHTPIPPPRRHRQKLIEQTYNDIYSHKEPVYEEPCIKSIKRKHICKIDEDRFYKQHVKHHSTVSLPNINELQLSLAKDTDDDTIKESDMKQRNSAETQSIESKKIGRLENYMMRCRSFGSLLPNKLVDKLKLSRRINSETAESDDSWGGLEDWDLGVIEHYKPHDNSLPRPVNKNKIYEYSKPVPPVRKTDSLLRKHRKENLTENNKNLENEQRNSGLKLVDIPTENFISGKENLNDNKNEQKSSMEILNNNSENNRKEKYENEQKNLNVKVGDIPTEILNNRKENLTENKNFENEQKTFNFKLDDDNNQTEVFNNSINENNNCDANDKIFKPTICFEEKKRSVTPPPTPEIIIPTIAPSFINTETSDHSTLMKLITEITSSNDSLSSSNQNDNNSPQMSSEFQQVSLSDILNTSSKTNIADNTNPMIIPTNDKTIKS